MAQGFKVKGESLRESGRLEMGDGIFLRKARISVAVRRAERQLTAAVVP